MPPPKQPASQASSTRRPFVASSNHFAWLSTFQHSVDCHCRHPGDRIIVMWFQNEDGQRMISIFCFSSYPSTISKSTFRIHQRLLCSQRPASSLWILESGHHHQIWPIQSQIRLWLHAINSTWLTSVQSRNIHRKQDTTIWSSSTLCGLLSPSLVSPLTSTLVHLQNGRQSQSALVSNLCDS